MVFKGIPFTFSKVNASSTYMQVWRHAMAILLIYLHCEHIANLSEDKTCLICAKDTRRNALYLSVYFIAQIFTFKSITIPQITNQHLSHKTFSWATLVAVREIKPSVKLTAKNQLFFFFFFLYPSEPHACFKTLKAP